MTTLLSGQPYTFLAYADCVAFASLETAGDDVGTIQRNLLSELQSPGLLRDVTIQNVQVTRNHLASDVLCASITATPDGRNIDTRELDATVLDGANKEAAGRVTSPLPSGSSAFFTPHQTGSLWLAAAGVSLADALLAPFGAAPAAPPASIGIVVDDTSVVQGATPLQPQASSSWLGSATSLVNTVASTDPTRNGGTVGGNALGVPSLSPYVVAALIAGASIMALAAVGYGLRPVADLVREAKG